MLKRNFFLFIGIVVGMVWMSNGVATALAFRMQDHMLNIFTSSPPVLLYVEDSQGRITGADSTNVINSVGMGSIIQEIPSSYTEAINQASDLPGSLGQPQPSTGWAVNILDHTTESFTIDLIVMTNGLAELEVNGIYSVRLKIPTIQNDINLFSAVGVTRQVQVSFDPVSKSLTTTPTINNGDFLRDTQSACGLGDIGPVAACEAFEALASEVEKAKTKGDTKVEAEDLEVYLFLLERLHLWGQMGQPGNWDAFKDHPECIDLCNDRLDDKFFITAPAYSALKLDAETLLAAIRPD